MRRHPPGRPPRATLIKSRRQSLRRRFHQTRLRKLAPPRPTLLVPLRTQKSRKTMGQLPRTSLRAKCLLLTISPRQKTNLQLMTRSQSRRSPPKRMLRPQAQLSYPMACQSLGRKALPTARMTTRRWWMFAASLPARRSAALTPARFSWCHSRTRAFFVMVHHRPEAMMAARGGSWALNEY